MRYATFALVTMALAGAAKAEESAAPATPAAKLKVAVLTGGHSFDHKAFFGMFQSYGDIQFNELVMKKDCPAFDDIDHWSYDVIVMYNMTPQITEKQKKNFLKLLDRGVGVVAMHHVAAAYPPWEQFGKIIGLKYFLQPTVVDGRSLASTYKEGVNYTIHVEDAAHPVTMGIKDFTVHDEVYGQCRFEPDNHYLLTCRHPASDGKLVWTRQYGKARICTILPGHGTTIFAEPAYRRLLHNAIFWVAAKK